MEIEVTNQPHSGPLEWGPDKLYNRSKEYRQILLLEVVAYAIVRMETFETEGEFNNFTRKLRRAREEVWGRRPWPAALEEDGFLRHLSDMAHVFVNATTAAEADYPNRQEQPGDV